MAQKKQVMFDVFGLDLNKWTKVGNMYESLEVVKCPYCSSSNIDFENGCVYYNDKFNYKCKKCNKIFESIS